MNPCATPFYPLSPGQQKTLLVQPTSKPATPVPVFPSTNRPADPFLVQQEARHQEASPQGSPNSIGRQAPAPAVEASDQANCFWYQEYQKLLRQCLELGTRRHVECDDRTDALNQIITKQGTEINNLKVMF